MRELCEQVEGFLVVEMNTGQMLDDVRLAAGGAHARWNSTAAWAAWCPSRMKILGEIRRLARGPRAPGGRSARRAGWREWSAPIEDAENGIV